MRSFGSNTFTNNISTNEIIEHPLPGINDWDTASIIQKGDMATIVPSTAGQYQLFSTENGKTSMWTSSNLIGWYNNIALYRSFEDFIWDGQQFIAWDDNSDDLYTIQLNGTLKSIVYLSYYYSYPNHVFWQKNDNTIQFMYVVSGGLEIKYRRIIGDTLDTAITTQTSISQSPFIYDMMQDSSDKYHLLYYDGEVKIKTTTTDWNIGVINKVASTEYTPQYIYEYNNELLVILSKPTISSVDGLSHNELFYTISNDAITWSTPIRMSPDNGHDKNYAQILPLDDGSFVLQYSFSGNIYLTRSSELLSAEIMTPTSKLGIGESAYFTALGLFSNGSVIANNNVLWEIYFPNRTLWFSMMRVSDIYGNSTFYVTMPQNLPGGYYYVKSSYQVNNYGVAVASSKFSYLYRDYTVPLYIENPNTTINSNILTVTVSGRYDGSVTQFWITLSVLDPMNYPYQSVTIAPFLFDNFSQLITLDLQEIHDIPTSGEYNAQLIFRNGPPKDGSEVIDFVDFTFTV